MRTQEEYPFTNEILRVEFVYLPHRSFTTHYEIETSSCHERCITSKQIVHCENQSNPPYFPKSKNSHSMLRNSSLSQTFPTSKPYYNEESF